MKKAIYAGTFDPITHGHIDVVSRATKLFDKIIIGVSSRPKNTLFTQRERMELVKTVFRNEKKIKVMGFSSLLVDFARKLGATTIIRGMRAVEPEAGTEDRNDILNAFGKIHFHQFWFG
jgi:pantetheine-phosphate adenylyltransferase